MMNTKVLLGAIFLSLALPSVGFAANERIDDNSAVPVGPVQPQEPAIPDPAIPDPKGSEFISNIPSGPLGQILEYLPLKDAIAFGSTQKKYRDDYNFWEKVALLHAPGLIKNERLFEKFRKNQEDPTQSLREDLQFARGMQTYLSKINQDNGRSLTRNAKFLAKIDAAYTLEFARGIQGILLLVKAEKKDEGDFEWGIALLSHPGTIVTEGMQKVINQAARYGYLGFTDATGRAYLERIVGDVSNVSNPGREHAQERLNHAERYGMLGFADEKSISEFIVKRVYPRDAHAEKRLNGHTRYGRPRFTQGTNIDYFLAVYNVLTGGEYEDRIPIPPRQSFQSMP